MAKGTAFMKILVLILILFVSGCCDRNATDRIIASTQIANVLDFSGTPQSPQDRGALAFSDQGAWFAYGFPTDTKYFGGFSGPFLMTQENGVYCSPSLSYLTLTNIEASTLIDFGSFKISKTSFISHLQQEFEDQELKVLQTLFFSSAHTAIISTQITNLSKRPIILQPAYEGDLFFKDINFEENSGGITIIFEQSNTKGHLEIWGDSISEMMVRDSAYQIRLEKFELRPGETKELIVSQSFVLPEYDWIHEQENINNIVANPALHLKSHIHEKEKQLEVLYSKMDSNFTDPVYKKLLTKTVLTLQNNWRIPSGALKHSGLFPSYHYKWFHGFWAWDSWKHAVALAHYDIGLAKNQVRAMYDFMDDDGFIPDCVYRDTCIEKHNYRNTKPPLSAWAVWEIYQQDHDVEFLEEMFPKIVRQHNWWYRNRDHDHDGLCEYGSTDGTLVAAKWESGMDNAVRFDRSKILKNGATAFSLDQESVDLNAYLYAEKKHLEQMAIVLGLKDAETHFQSEAKSLQKKMQLQFFDRESGWFFDTSIDGKHFIKVMGCEGWIPLWADVATLDQAEAVKNNMMDISKFNGFVPFQTLSADQPDFEPEGGYWRGPVWLDQAYFGVKALRNYGNHKEANEAAYKLILNAQGVLSKGKSIRENYNPITGAGLESENFSWSAAHYLLLIISSGN